MSSERISEPGPQVAGENDSSPVTPRASRRAFLVRTSAAAAGAAALGTGLLGVGPAEASTRRVHESDLPDSNVADKSVVAYVSDASTGEITLMSGDREISVTDHQLARALARKVG